MNHMIIYIANNLFPAGKTRILKIDIKNYESKTTIYSSSSS